MQEQDVIVRLKAADPARGLESLNPATDLRAASMLRRMLEDPWAPRRRLLRAGTDRSRPAPRRARRFASAGLASAVAAAAVIGVAVMSGTPTPAVVTSGSAHAELVAAAVRASHDTSPKGKYWVYKGKVGTVLHRDHDGHAYTVRLTYPVDGWSSPKTREATENLGALDATAIEPLTPADAAAYRADGSPTDLDTEFSTDDGYASELAGGLIYEGDPNTLPTDPIKLRNAMLSWGPTDVPDLVLSKVGLGNSKYHHPEAWLFREGTKLLDAGPRNSPRVRASVYRMLAGLPGVHTLKGSTDPLGRPAVGIGLTQQTGSAGQVEWQIYLSPSSDRLMDTQVVVLKPGEKNSYLASGTVAASRTITSADWSNKP